MKKISLLILWFLTIWVSSNSQSSLNTTLIGHWPYGPCKVVQESGDLVVAGSGCVLFVIDKGNPFAPIVLDELHLSGVIEDIKIIGEYAYVANGFEGLKIVNISNPSSIYEIGNLNCLGNIVSIDIVSEYAYIVLREGGLYGLKIINVSDPTTPFIIGHYSNIGNHPSDITIFDSIAYITDEYDGIYIFDISNPVFPNLISLFSITASNCVDLSGDFAYITNQYGLTIINISNPYSPFEVGYIDLQGATCGVKILDDHAYVAAQCQGLCILDIVDPANPSLLSTCNTPGRAMQVDVSNNIAFVADLGHGFSVVDIEDPLCPEIIASFENNYGSVNKVAVVENYAYLLMNDNGINIIDISNPYSPILSAHYQAMVTDIVIDNNQAFTTGIAGLLVLDITNPANPNIISQYPTNGFPNSLKKSGNHIYIADGDNGMRIINTTDPASPFEIGFYQEISFAYALDLNETHAFVISSNEGLHIINIENPFIPNQEGFYEGNFQDIAVKDNHAFLTSCYPSYLKILDVSNPASPILMSTYSTPGNSYGIEVCGVYAYIASYYNGLQIVDISNPISPIQAGYYDTPSRATDVCVSGLNAYLSDNNAGMLIIQNDLIVNVDESISPTSNTSLNLKCFPNPAYSITNISYSIPNTCNIKIDIFNAQGNIILEKFYNNQQVGKHYFEFASKDIEAGEYLIQIQAWSIEKNLRMSETAKLIITK